MKNFTLLITILFISTANAIAQTPYNPFTQNIHFAPEPTVAGFQCGTVQTVVFTQGLTTADDATLWATDPLTVKICLAGFQFNGLATAIVSGSYASNFNWAFDSTSSNCIIGTQNQNLIGTGTNPIFPNPLSSGNISISLLVPSSSPVSTVLSVDVTLQVPAYMATFNSVPDDNESTQTQTYCDCYALTDAGVISSDQSFCGGGDPTLFASLNSGSGGSGGVVLYQWQELIGSTWTDITGETTEVFDAPFTLVNSQYRRKAKRSLCGDWLNSNVLSITINALPIADAGSDKNLNCLITSATIGSTDVAGSTYLWSPSIGLNSTTIAQPISNPTSTTTYTLTVTDVNGCSATDIITVDVNTIIPSANAGLDKNLNCLVSSAIIGSFAVVGNSYSWSPTNGMNLSNVAQPTITPSITTTYTVTVTNVNGCTATDEVLVNVDNLPPFADAGSGKSLCVGDSISIGTPAITGNVYLWTPAAGLNSASIAQPLAGPFITTAYTVTVTGTNGCTATDVIIVSVDTCIIDISGTVYNDTNALTNLNVDGIGIHNPDGVPLYAHLIDINGNILRVTPITLDGTYEFLGVQTNQSYIMVLSTIQGSVGNPAPLILLPGTWDNTGEDCCDQIGDDGNPDGSIAFSVANFAKVNIDFGIKDPNATSLPVDLESFYVIDYNCEALLSWITTQEINTSHVQVFRRDNGQGAYRKIATVQSAGNSNEKKMYSYLDKEVSKDAVYEYQLRFVDVDGQFTQSDIKALKLDCSNDDASIKIFPNPATNEINLLCVSDENEVEFSIDINDIAGRKIVSKSQMMYKGGTVITIDISALAVGTYILNYRDAEGLFVGSEKFIKH